MYTFATMLAMLRTYNSKYRSINHDYGMPNQLLRATKPGKRKKFFKYKPAFTCGFRGFPRTEIPLGITPAPTIDQVRRLERKYKTKLIVKLGLIYFKKDGEMFTKTVAIKRLNDIEVATGMCTG